MLYKLVKGKNIVGVATESDFRKFQPKHNRVLFSDVENGEFVEYKEKYYRDDWLRVPPAGAPSIIDAKIIRIDRNEYEEIAEQLDDGNLPEDSSLDEETEVPVDNPNPEETETVQKTAAQILEEQIRNLEEWIGLADRDADMIADSNIVAGKYFMSGNTLYRATANIASGTRITVGVNAEKISISDALNKINA